MQIASRLFLLAKEDHAENVVRIVVGRLRRLREERGYSLRKLAALSGVSSTAITNIENGRRSPTLYTLVRLADALGTTMANCMLDEEVK